MTFEEAKAAYDEALLLEVDCQVQFARCNDNLSKARQTSEETESNLNEAIELVRNRYFTLIEARKQQREENV